MKTKILELLAKDRKLRAIFSGMVSSGTVFIGLVVIAGVMYL